ncbi:MAG: hypothetical protein HGA65_10800 [Oscillochloris sp.]|nr:hypothetical protein [Oscillochloris sp.]
MLSFEEDTAAGSMAICKKKGGEECTKSVPWFNQFLGGKNCVEIPGDHLEPMGIRICDNVYRPSCSDFSAKFPRPVDTEINDLLNIIDPKAQTLALAIEKQAAKAALAAAQK